MIMCYYYSYYYYYYYYCYYYYYDSEEEEEEEADVPFFWRRRRPGPDFETRPICKDFMFLDTDMVVLDRMEVDKCHAKR